MQCNCVNRKWAYTTKYVSTEEEIRFPNDCFAFFVTNIGGTLALVNNYPLNPRLVPGTNGESMGADDNQIGEIDMPGLEIKFPNGPGQVVVLFQHYTKKC